MRTHILRIEYRYFSISGSPHQSMEEHEELITYLVQGDEEKIRQLILGHWDKSIAELERHLFIVGFQLGKFRLRELLASRECYVLAAVRLLVLPLVLVIASHFLFAGLTLFLKIVILEYAMPAATCGVILVQKYGGDIRYMSRGVVMTTLFSIVTIPLMVIVMEAI